MLQLAATNSSMSQPAATNSSKLQLFESVPAIFIFPVRVWQSRLHHTCMLHTFDSFIYFEITMYSNVCGILVYVCRKWLCHTQPHVTHFSQSLPNTAKYGSEYQPLIMAHSNYVFHYSLPVTLPSLQLCLHSLAHLLSQKSLNIHTSLVSHNKKTTRSRLR